MRAVKTCATGVGFMIALLLQHSALAFKIDATVPPTSSRPSSCSFDNEEQGNAYAQASFGDPVHETMTALSIQRAKEHPTSCSADDKSVEAFWKKPERPQRTILACCRYTKGSSFCRCLNNDIRKAAFADEDPVKTGSRWPDDPCHMLARGDTYFIMPQWIVVGKSSWGNNLAYSSHLHYFAFMHSMASSDQKASKSGEKTETTRLRILVWLEFAFKVAEGVIPSTARFSEVPGYLDSKEAQEQFRTVFPGYVGSKNWTVDFFFTGIYNAEARYVQQLALGSTLHTMQDAFSDSHVKRGGRPKAPAPVTNPGPVQQFLDYKLHNKILLHPTADARPPDMSNVPKDKDALHPVSVGAEVVSCAAGNRPPGQSNWKKAVQALEPVYRLDQPREKYSGKGAY